MHQNIINLCKNDISFCCVSLFLKYKHLHNLKMDIVGVVHEHGSYRVFSLSFAGFKKENKAIRANDLICGF